MVKIRHKKLQINKVLFAIFDKDSVTLRGQGSEISIADISDKTKYSPIVPIQCATKVTSAKLFPVN